MNDIVSVAVDLSGKREVPEVKSLPDTEEKFVIDIGANVRLVLDKNQLESLASKSDQALMDNEITGGSDD